MTNIDLSTIVNTQYDGVFNNIANKTNTAGVALDQKKVMTNKSKEHFMLPINAEIPDCKISAAESNTDKQGDTVQGDKIEIINTGVNCTNNYAGFIQRLDEFADLKKTIAEKDELINSQAALILTLKDTIEMLNSGK